MATYGSIEYKVITGTVAAIATFNASVETEINAGFAPIVEAKTDGTNIWQVMAKGTGGTFVAEYPITTATVGLAGLGSFKIAGDQTQNFHAGYRFTVVGSTANNGVYTVKNGGSSFGGGSTTIPVNEAVPDATVDGSVIGYAP